MLYIFITLPMIFYRTLIIFFHLFHLSLEKHSQTVIVPNTYLIEATITPAPT